MRCAARRTFCTVLVNPQPASASTPTTQHPVIRERLLERMEGSICRLNDPAPLSSRPTGDDRLPIRKIGNLLFQSGQQLLVFQIPQGLIPRAGGQEGRIGDHLAQAQFRGQCAESRQLLEDFLAAGAPRCTNIVRIWIAPRKG